MKPNLSERDALALYTIIEALSERDTLRKALTDTERKLAAAREGLRGISRERRWNGYRFVETEAAKAASAALASIENSSPQTTEKPNHQ